MNQKIKRVKAVDVGRYITEDHSKFLIENFHKAYPDTVSHFIFSKALAMKVLSLSKTITGIRFMYGLEDELNLNSIRILLIPCTNATEYSENSKPLIFKEGYFDHLENRRNLKDTCQLIANFVRYMKKQDNSLEYKRVTRGGFIGRNSFVTLVEDTKCAHVAINLGLDNKVIKPVFEPLTSLLEPYQGVFMDFLHPCPPFCEPDPDSCFSSMAVDLYSNDKQELDLYRKFRDTRMLDLVNGAMHFELYYFISPLIAMAISNDLAAESILKSLYFEKISPMKKLLEEKQYQQALNWLDQCLDKLIEDYQTPLLEISN